MQFPFINSNRHITGFNDWIKMVTIFNLLSDKFVLIHGGEEKMKNGYFHWISVMMRVGQVFGQSA